MEEETVGEVLYETRYHASRPYTSNYPPQSSKTNEGAKGGLLSFLSSIGISQIKEKWSDYRNPTKIKKRISLFISPRAEHVAVATGNQITILQKEDDYQEPCGIFTSGNHDTFTYGAWSESHDILGVADDADTLYFIKANGEEMSRLTKRQLKVSLKIIGLFPQDDTDAEGSCLCSFIVLTSDGFLHHVEISQEPSVSIASRLALHTGSSAESHFPKDVFCFDYDPKHALLLVVGSSISISGTTSGHSGSCHLSLWRRCQSLRLEPLFSIQFEGLYCKPKDYVGHLAYPKLLMSPKGKFVGTLDITGCLHIFKLDKERCLLSSFVSGERLGSQVTYNSADGDNAQSNILDFTWWSDHIVTLANRDGIITMLDIVTGFRFQENDPAYSMPILDRVKKFPGCIFLLESKLLEESKIPSSLNGESSESHLVKWIIEESCNQFDFSHFCWRLISILQRSVPEMYNILIRNHNYQAALAFANRHGLDRDEVLKSQWLHSDQGINEMNMFLSNIKDHDFVLTECVDKVGSTEDAVKALLAFGLRTTEKFRFLVSEDLECSQIWDYRVVRLQLLQFRDRLETYLGINMGRFSVQEYRKFRIVPLNEAAVTLAESGKIGALNLLFKRHPYSLSPFMLQILAAIPETIPVQTYAQLLPGRSPPSSIVLREEDWVESDKMVSFINGLTENHEIGIQIRTEPVVNRCLGYFWPSTDELSLWYKNRASDIDCYSGQLDSCLCLVDFACRKGIIELQKFNEDISYLHQLVYSDESEGEICFNMSLVLWEQLSDYEKFRMMLKGVKGDNVVKKLHDTAIPFMQKRFGGMTTVTQDQVTGSHVSLDHKDESFLVRWLKEIALENKLDICLVVIEEACKELQSNGFFKDKVEAVDCALQCMYLCKVTDRWSSMATILLKLPQKLDLEVRIEGLEKRLQLAEGHIEAGRLLSFYQVPKPMNFFLEAHADEKGIKQIVRLILSKFVRRQPGRSDNDWANMWRDMQCLRDKGFPFLDPEYMLMEFCRGLLKAGKFSLARNYLKGTSSVPLASEKAESLVIQATREYFFSASSLSCSEIWKAKECLNLFPSSRNVQAEADIIDALTVKLPNLGVTLLPMQFRQIKDPMEIIKMAITSQSGAYLHVDELIEVAKLLGLSSSDDISAVEEAIAREAAVGGDLQLAFDLCLVLAKKGHGPIWDLCVAIARGPALENMDTSSRKQLLGFALSHCDEESIGELLYAWKDLDMQGQLQNLLLLTETSPTFSFQGSSNLLHPGQGVQDIIDPKECSALVEGISENNQVCLSRIKNTLSSVAKYFPVETGTNLESFLRENGKILSFAAFQLPWLLELSRKAENGKKFTSDFIPGKQYVSIQTQALATILSWLARNGFVPRDTVIASLAKSIIEPPVSEKEDAMGCSFLLNLMDAFSGVEVIEEQLKIREDYQEICSIMNVGMTYSLLHNSGVECKGSAQRRELLLRKFKEKHTPLSSDEINKIDELQSTFWREWKLKLEEKKRITEHSRFLEQIIPGVETARFLSGDLKYIENAVYSLIESVKLDKKCIMKDVLKLADTYGLNHTKVLLQYLSSILVSEVWTDDEIAAEISEVKGEIIGCASEIIKTFSLDVFPAIDGHNKLRLAYIYGLLSDCYLCLEETKESIPMIPSFSSHLSTLELAHLYKVIEQECCRVSFIKNLNFKNIAGLDGLNLQSFSSEIYGHIDEFSLEALAKMVQALASFYPDSVPEGLIMWQDVYKHYVLSMLKTLENRAITEFNIGDPEKFQEFINELEHTYDFCRMHIKILAPSDALDFLKHYFTVILPLHGSCGSIPDNSTWQECLIILLKFWCKLTEEMLEIASSQNSVAKLRFDPECLSHSLKVFMRLVMEDSVSPSQGWGTILYHVSSGFAGEFAVEILIFCRAMVFAGCGFGAISEVFSEVMSQCAISSTSIKSLDLPHLYINMLEAILRDLASESHQHEHLYHLLSSLSKLDGHVEDLQRVRCVVWERMAQFSDNMQLPSHVRVYALELMQFIAGRNNKASSGELQSNVLPWEGWDGLLSTSKRTELTASHGFQDHTDTSSRFTSTLAALKSSQLVAAICPNIEITSNDLLNVETAVSCFLKLCEASNTDSHFDALVALLEQWEGLFAAENDDTGSAKASEAGNSWSNDDWDEGWENFQEMESLGKEKMENSLHIHPLHVCWMEILKKLIILSQFNNVLKLIDQSLSKSNGILLDEDGTTSLTQVILEMNCFVALKLVLLLPYEAIQLQCLGVVEDKLKQGLIPDSIGWDQEFLILVLSSGIMSTIITKPLYGNTFSYLCYLVGNFSRQCQEAQLSRLRHKGRKECINVEKDSFFIFRRILFPCFVSELVKADQQILAGFLVTKFMHTNTSLSLVNVTEASLSRYLERELHALQHDVFVPLEINSSEILKNAVSKLTDKLASLIQTALSLLSTVVR